MLRIATWKRWTWHSDIDKVDMFTAAEMPKGRRDVVKRVASPGRPETRFDSWLSWCNWYQLMQLRNISKYIYYIFPYISIVIFKAIEIMKLRMKLYETSENGNFS